MPGQSVKGEGKSLFTELSSSTSHHHPINAYLDFCCEVVKGLETSMMINEK